MYLSGCNKFLHLAAVSHLKEGRDLHYQVPVSVFIGPKSPWQLVFHGRGLHQVLQGCGTSVALVSGKASNSQEVLRLSKQG